MKQPEQNLMMQVNLYKNAETTQKWHSYIYYIRSILPLLQFLIRLQNLLFVRLSELK
jgi:hypothetical protein